MISSRRHEPRFLRFNPWRLVSAAALFLLAAPRCAPAASSETTGPDASASAAPVCSAVSDAHGTSGAASSGHPVLFGRPSAATGLSDAQCQPKCDCQGGEWEAPVYGQADVDALATWKLVTPFPELTSDPYAGPAPVPSTNDDEVCAVVPQSTGSHDYTLQTFASQDEAKSHGAIPTHFGACGLCSPLVDLGVYMLHPDLTEPVRACGLQHLTGPMSALVQCLQDLGFDRPCAEIWAFNTAHTGVVCAGVCLGANDAAYNQPDGSLNPCLQCDEDKSGAVFKAVAGRTRRNTGIASVMCRPCSEARPLLHSY